jgi:hypothetical protein
MQSFTLITLILVFFFLARQIRLLATLATGSYAAGVLIPDMVIAGLLLFYITYSLGFRPIQESKLDRVKLFLLAILALAFLQSVYFAGTFDKQGESVLIQAFSSFRRVFMPLSLLFLFSFLIKTEIAKTGDLIFKRLSTLFTIFLWVAIAYNLLEFTLRTTIPELKSFYLDYYILHTHNLDVSVPAQVGDFEITLLRDLTGLRIKRAYGIGLDLYTSGGIIFLCYLFHVFLSGKFRVLSILNCLVFVALLLSGSRQFFFPFLVLNAIIFAWRHGRKNFLARIFIGAILAGWIIFIVRVMTPSFASGGQFWLSLATVNPIKENLGLFIFGNGPLITPLYGGDAVVGETQAYLFRLVYDTGFLTIILEVGLIMLALFVLFHIIVFKENGNISRRGQLPDPYIRGLKILIVLGMFVTLAHIPILFDRTIIVFHVLFVALLYSWAKYRRTSNMPAPEDPRLFQLGSEVVPNFRTRG